MDLACFPVHVGYKNMNYPFFSLIKVDSACGTYTVMGVSSNSKKWAIIPHSTLPGGCVPIECPRDRLIDWSCLSLCMQQWKRETNTENWKRKNDQDRERKAEMGAHTALESSECESIDLFQIKHKSLLQIWLFLFWIWKYMNRKWECSFSFLCIFKKICELCCIIYCNYCNVCINLQIIRITLAVLPFWIQVFIDMLCTVLYCHSLPRRKFIVWDKCIYLIS